MSGRQTPGAPLGFFPPRCSAALRVSQVRMTEPEPWTRPKARDLLLELEDRSTQPTTLMSRGRRVVFLLRKSKGFVFSVFSRNLGRVCPSASRYHDSVCLHRKDNQRSNQKAKREFRGGAVCELTESGAKRACCGPLLGHQIKWLSNRSLGCPQPGWGYWLFFRQESVVDLDATCAALKTAWDPFWPHGIRETFFGHGSCCGSKQNKRKERDRPAFATFAVVQ